MLHDNKRNVTGSKKMSERMEHVGQEAYEYAPEVAKLEEENETLKRRVEFQEQSILAMEEDQACLPENISVTEYVATLKREKDKLREALLETSREVAWADADGPNHANRKRKLNATVDALLTAEEQS